VGYPGLPVYGREIGSAIQDLEKVIELIKTNKFSKNDLLKIYEINNEIIKYLINEN
jgi:hypothetical protein